MKKKGSALVFSILMLTFFLAISLNTYFLTQKKAQRAGVKVQGEVTTNNIDIASSLGYQELLIAENFVRNGFLYSGAHPSISGNFNNNTYTQTDGNFFYLDLSTGFYKSGEKYAGIQLNNFIDYFSSQWDYTAGTVAGQKLILGEEISDGKAVNRMWQSAGIPDKLIPLWDPSLAGSGISLGGYRLTTSSIDLSDTSVLPDNGAPYTFTSTYEKSIRLKDVVQGTTTLIPQSDFRIQVVESFTAIKSSSIVTISGRNIESFIIEAID